MQNNKCKICRRVGTKLFLKGEKCVSPKCPIVKRPYPPGFQGKRKKRRRGSDYDKQLREKQKLKNYYNLREHQLKSYVKRALGKKGRAVDTQTALIQFLEKRLDNTVFRLGFAPSRTQARQLVSHGHILVNGKKVDIASYQINEGDKIDFAPGFQKKGLFQNLALTLKKYQAPKWLKLEADKMKGQVKAEPSFDEAAPPADLSAIFEYYSR